MGMVESDVSELSRRAGQAAGLAFRSTRCETYGRVDTVKIAVLDDCHRVALSMADWRAVPGDA